MVKAVKSTTFKDMVSPKSAQSQNPYYFVNERLKLQEKPSPTKPVVAEAISDILDPQFGNSFESKVQMLESN